MVRDHQREAAVAIAAATVLAALAAPARGVADEASDGVSPVVERPTEMPAVPTALPVFLRDTALAVRLRTYYVDAQPVRGVGREAWAAGGWIAYRSGWLLEVVQVGATGYGSAPVYDPADKADTLLLAPGGEGYYVLGEAFAALRYGEYALLKGYRQIVQQPYIDPQDNAMTPNTFEGVTLGGTLGGVRYAAGYLTRIKTRNADTFVSMSEAAGARGSDRGVAMTGVKLAPWRGAELEVAEQLGVDTFNTAFVHVEQDWAIGDRVRLRLGGQFTDQRAVGDALVATARVKGWATRCGSARLALALGSLTLKAGGSVTATGNRIQSPWGFYPGYLRLAQFLFDNAGEKAWLAGVGYDFSQLVARGLSASADLARGVGAVDPVKGARLPDEAELDLSVIYQPPAKQFVRFRVIGALLDQAGAERTGYQVRVIANWEMPVVSAGEGPRGGRGP